MFFSLCCLHAGFWDSELCNKRKSSVSGETVCEISQQRLKQWLSPRVSPAIAFTRTPSELECSQSNGALCFINPLFLQTHQTNPSPKKQESSPGNADCQNSEDSVFCRAKSTQNKSHASVSRSKSERSPPPRPPPPCFASGRSAVLRKQKTMPETVCWIKTPQEKSSLLGRLGSSFSSLSPSSSPPKKFSKPILVPSSHSKISSGLLDADGLRCHMAMDDQTIEEAVSWSLAKLSSRNSTALENCSPTDERCSTRTRASERYQHLHLILRLSRLHPQLLAAHGCQSLQNRAAHWWQQPGGGRRGRRWWHQLGERPGGATTLQVKEAEWHWYVRTAACTERTIAQDEQRSPFFDDAREESHSEDCRAIQG